MNDIPGIWFPEIFARVQKLPKLANVVKLDSISADEFCQHASKSVPFVLRNACQPLPAITAIELMRESWSDHQIEIRSSRFESPLQYVDRTLKRLSLGDFLSNYWGKDNNCYAGNNRVTDDQLKTINLDYPPFYPRAFFHPPKMWMGPRGTVTPLHKDIPDNFVLNYFGKKRWLIFSPIDFPSLYMINPTPSEFPDLGVSLVDISAPNLQAFPDYVNASPLEFFLSPGEMLYLPAGWAHYVEHIENSLSFNFWLLREKSPASLGRDI